MTGSGGSGILIARKSDGTWSPPSGIMLHTPTLSFVIGVDIYDCILVISDLTALEAITRPRVTLGEDVGLASGQSVALDSAPTDFQWSDPGSTVLTYLKARGQDQHVNLTGSILTERANENERFYAPNISQMDILAGNVRDVEETKPLLEVIKMAEGRTDFDAAIVSRIAATAAPGDALIASPTSNSASSALSFGVPSVADPDPFGILALEMAGLEIREAGSSVRPPSSQLNFGPSLTSPTLSKFSRQSVDTFATQSRRQSSMSTHTIKSQTTDTGTQTDAGKSTPGTVFSPEQGVDSPKSPPDNQIKSLSEVSEDSAAEVDYTTIDTTPLRHISGPPSIRSETSADEKAKETSPPIEPDRASKASSTYGADSDSDGGHATDDEDDVSDMSDLSDDELVVFEVAAVQPARTQAVASRVVQAKGSMVTIPKRLPPPLPMRNPGRRSRLGNAILGENSGPRSPLRQEFGEESQNTQAAENGEPQIVDSTAAAEAAKDSTGEEISAAKPEADVLAELQRASPDPPRIEVMSSSDVLSASADTSATGEQSEQLPVQTDLSASEEGTTPTAETPVAGFEGGDETASIATSRASTDTTSSLSGRKHPSSIFTGPADGSESANGSSVTTPTSERPFSLLGDHASDETPKKLVPGAEHSRTSTSLQLEDDQSISVNGST